MSQADSQPVLLHNFMAPAKTKTKTASAPSIQNSSGFKLRIAPTPKKSVLEVFDTIGPFWDEELNAEDDEVDQAVVVVVVDDDDDEGDGDEKRGDSDDDEEEEEDRDEPAHLLTPKSLKRKRMSKKDEGECSMQYNTVVPMI